MLARRASWSITDQVLSSLSNFALSVLVARQVSADQYGAFALAFTLYGYLVTVSRLLVSQPLAIRFSGAEPTDFVQAARQSTGAALLVGLLPAAGMALTGLLVSSTVAETLVVTAAVLPGLLLQDSWRTVFIASGRPAAAAANDAFWGVAQIAGVVAVTRLGHRSAVGYLLAWGLAGCAAAALGAVQASFGPAPQHAWRWLKSHWDLTRYFVSELAVINGATQLMLVLVAAIGGLAVVGALRGAQVFTGPVQILALSGIAFVTPELARRPWIVGPRLMRAGLGVSAAAEVPTIAWAILLLLLPESLGRQLMGDTWAGVQPILVPTVVGMVLATMSLGATCGHYATGLARVLFPLQLAVAPTYLLGGLAGVLAGGAFGAATGIAVAHALNTIVSWIRFAAAARLAASNRQGAQEGADPR
jgi:O-antigen/teichoic acid export membrane protein